MKQLFPLALLAAQDMEALEVDDISPALEVTEDFFNSFDTKLEKIVQPSEVYGVQEVPELVGHEVFDQITESRNLRNVTSLAKSNLIWDHCKNGLLETKAQTAFPAKEQRLVQRGTAADSLAWAGEGETAAFNIFSICQRRRDRPRSVNDILVQNEESSKFKPGHNRSRSDISHVNWGMVFTGTSLQQPPLPGQDNNCALLSYLALTKGEDIQGNTGLYRCFIVSVDVKAFIFVFNIYLEREVARLKTTKQKKPYELALKMIEISMALISLIRF